MEQAKGRIFDTVTRHDQVRYHCALMDIGDLPKKLLGIPGKVVVQETPITVFVPGDKLAVLVIHKLVPELETSHEIACCLMGLRTTVDPGIVSIVRVTNRGQPQMRSDLDACIFDPVSDRPDPYPVDWGMVDDEGTFEIALTSLDGGEHAIIMTLAYSLRVLGAAKPRPVLATMPAQIDRILYVRPNGEIWRHDVGTLCLTPVQGGGVIGSRWNGATWDLLGKADPENHQNLAELVRELTGYEKDKEDEPETTGQEEDTGGR